MNNGETSTQYFFVFLSFSVSPPLSSLKSKALRFLVAFRATGCCNWARGGHTWSAPFYSSAMEPGTDGPSCSWLPRLRHRHAPFLESWPPGERQALFACICMIVPGALGDIFAIVNQTLALFASLRLCNIPQANTSAPSDGVPHHESHSPSGFNTASGEPHSIDGSRHSISDVSPSVDLPICVAFMSVATGRHQWKHTCCKRYGPEDGPAFFPHAMHLFIYWWERGEMRHAP